jgi:plasmid stabilization system protein ParE
MPKRSVLSRSARADVRHYANYLAKKWAGLDESFHDGIRSTVAKLADMPGLGSPGEFHDPRLSALRVKPVDGFPNHLLVYYELGAVLRVIAVIHGARDFEQILIHRLES